MKKNDGETTAQPKKVIPVDYTIFPDAKTDEVKKEERKKKTAFHDYQLEVARRLMIDKIDAGKDFYAADSGMPKDAPPAAATADAAAAEPKGEAKQ